MPNVLNDNAALFIGLLRALLIFLVAEGVNITQAQQDSAIALLAAVLPVVSLFFTALTIKTTVPKKPSADAPSTAIQQPPTP